MAPDVEISAVKADGDHFHSMIEYPPTLAPRETSARHLREICETVRRLKGVSGDAGRPHSPHGSADARPDRRPTRTRRPTD